MKKLKKSLVLNVFILFIIATHNFCNAQHEPFEFEFGTSTTLENALKTSSEEDSKIKWINVNTVKKGWTVNNEGVLVNLGHPIGVVRSEKQYENFILHVEWRHMEPGGNSGVFAWSNGNPEEGKELPDGVEIQMLELDWININAKDGIQQPIAYVHGEVWGVGGVVTIPDNPRGERSKSIENRALGKGIWNTYDVVAIDGVIKLSVNGKFVNGISKSTQKKGYLCLESEGAEIHFRNFKVIELPPGVTSSEQTAPQLK
ncbi:DUF1080 domain-containing protein [uncultured Kriegella sp.]|uniref:3-keto-disaccharide hydrolase n=1 Tax=uncultured Kriegella sp. TaxID=1798910 RepID=UPI0030D8437B|tara:strand:- start:119979 stop:120752 length:774 start_codon:yes stop_codon:yes gene_type:complete